MLKITALYFRQGENTGKKSSKDTLYEDLDRPSSILGHKLGLDLLESLILHILFQWS